MAKVFKNLVVAASYLQVASAAPASKQGKVSLNLLDLFFNPQGSDILNCRPVYRTQAEPPKTTTTKIAPVSQNCSCLKKANKSFLIEDSMTVEGDRETGPIGENCAATLMEVKPSLVNPKDAVPKVSRTVLISGWIVMGIPLAILLWWLALEGYSSVTIGNYFPVGLWCATLMLWFIGTCMCKNKRFDDKSESGQAGFWCKVSVFVLAILGTFVTVFDPIGQFSNRAHTGDL